MTDTARGVQPHDPTPDLDAACRVLHNAYETAAARHGWHTNEHSRVPWDDVPPANKATMRDAVTALLDHLHTHRPGWEPDGWVDGVVMEADGLRARITVLERDLDAARQAVALLDAECNALAGDVQPADDERPLCDHHVPIPDCDRCFTDGATLGSRVDIRSVGWREHPPGCQCHDEATDETTRLRARITDLEGDLTEARCQLTEARDLLRDIADGPTAVTGLMDNAAWRNLARDAASAHLLRGEVQRLRDVACRACDLAWWLGHPDGQTGHPDGGRAKVAMLRAEIDKAVAP